MKHKRIISLVLTVAMVLSMCMTGFAVNTSETDAPAICTCETQCTEGTVDSGCYVCGENGADLNSCKGEEITPPEPECTCETKCEEGAVNADCHVCGGNGADLEACTGVEAILPEKECTCDTKCATDSINPDCVVCNADINACEGDEPEEVSDTMQLRSSGEVWIDGVKGNDENDGSSIDFPVKTIQKAMKLAGEGGTIIVKEQITIEKEPDLTLENVTIKRMDKYPYDSKECLGRILYISESTVTLKNVVIDGNMDNQGGNWGVSPLIWSYESELTISGKTQLRNNALKAMMLYSSNVTMEDGEIYNIGTLNNDNSRGIELYGGSQFTMKGGSIHDIEVAGSGAAFYTTDENSKLIMTGGEIYDNHGKKSGGAIYFHGTIEITGGKIYNNSTDKNAGAIMIVNPEDNFIGGTAEIYGNRSGLPSFPAGAIRVVKGTLTIGDNAVIRDNAAGGGGGGVCLDSGTVIVKDKALIYNNISYGMPGADIAVERGATLTIYDISKRMDLPEFKAEIPERGFNIDGWYYDGYDNSDFKWISAENVVKVDFKEKDAITFQSVNQTVGFIAAYEAHKVYYQYITETEGAELPSTSEGLPSVPTDSTVYIKGNTITLEKPSKTQFVGPKSDKDDTQGVWTFKGWKYSTPEGGMSGLITTDTLVVSEDILVKNTHVARYHQSTCVELTGIWEWSQDDVPWYYEVYYETFNEYGGSQWNLLVQEECEPTDPAANVYIVPEKIVTTHQNELKQHDILTGDPEQLGNHYVYYDDYRQNRLSAQAGDASKENPLKIYFKAAEHKITYEYEGTVPDGATEELPRPEKARYRQTVYLDELNLTGYTFSGWRVKSPEEAQKLLDDDELTMPNENVTLVGSWTKRDPAVISPADMTIYMGGESGCDGILDAEGNVISSKSLPEPFFKITLPSDVDQDTTINMIYLNAYNADHSGGTWMLIPCGEGSDFYRSISFNYESSEGQEISLSSPPIKFTKGNDVKMDDSFDPAESLHQTLTMEIWENLAAADVTELNYIGTNSNGDEVDGRCKFEFIKNDNGLIVRGTTENPQYAEINAESTVEGTISAAAPEGTTYTYYVGGEYVPVWDKLLEEEFGIRNDMDIALLTDNIINSKDDDREAQLKARADTYFKEWGNSATYSYEFKYLDLVDRNNGNALVNASNPVTISWPIPEEATADAQFTVLHFKDLHRESNDGTISACGVEEITPSVGNGNVVFTIQPKNKDADGNVTGGFSPFALAWTTTKTCRVQFVAGEHGSLSGMTESQIVENSSLQDIPTVTAKDGYVFTEWKDQYGKSYSTEQILQLAITQDMTFTAQYAPITSQVYTVEFLQGEYGTLQGQVEFQIAANETMQSNNYTVPTVRENSDYSFTNWLGDDGRVYSDADILSLVINQNRIFTAQYEKDSDGGAHHPEVDPDDKDDDDDDKEEITEDEEVPLAETPWLNTEDHYAYIIGYSEDGTVRPNANITRAEVATIFFRLLTDEARDQFWSTSNNFSDVASDAWYNNAVSTMVNAGIIQGYEDGTFRPNNNITRAEFAAIASRFMSSGYDVEKDLFTDIANHWARESINDAAMTKWINGYPDGTFLPDKAITRAEAVTLVNNVLQRKPDADHMLDSMIKWPDNMDTSAWYYEAIQEATNSHDYDLFEGAEYETWTALQENRDWAALEKDWLNAHRTGGEVM